MVILNERDEREGAGHGVRRRRGAKRHDQAVIQAEIRRLARGLDTDLVSERDPVDAAAIDGAQALGELS